MEETTSKQNKSTDSLPSFKEMAERLVYWKMFKNDTVPYRLSNIAEIFRREGFSLNSSPAKTQEKEQLVVQITVSLRQKINKLLLEIPDPEEIAKDLLLLHEEGISVSQNSLHPNEFLFGVGPFKVVPSPSFHPYGPDSYLSVPDATIKLDFDNNGYFPPMVTSTTNVHKYGCWHPHVHPNQGICLGEARDAVQLALNQFRIADVVHMILGVLKTYCPSNPFIKLDELINVSGYKCTECNEREMSAKTCVKCHAIVCEKCGGHQKKSDWLCKTCDS